VHLKKWFLFCLSVLLACATAGPPVVIISMDSSSMGYKRHIEIRDRAYTVTTVALSPEGKPVTNTREGKLLKETYLEILNILDHAKLADLKATYTDKTIVTAKVNTTLLDLTYKGQKKSVFILGATIPSELAPLLEIITPLMHV
jgi:hypothetical protein